MAIPTIFETCQPRSDILKGAISDADFAADLAKVLNGEASPLYQDPAIFFANTHPTRGLKNLLRNIFGQLSGDNASVSSIFRLDTNYGGGKTHALIALAHVAAGMQGVANIAEFIDPALLPIEPIRVAAFDGENADPVNGRLMGDGIRAHTPWGELAYALAGKAGYEIVRKSDEEGVAPGADTIRELVGDKPVLILLDELSIYLRKASAATQGEKAYKQLSAFLNALCKAVEAAPKAALVYTLAIGKNDGKAIDAFASENEKIAEAMRELKSISARKATLLDPTEEDETVQVLRRRLFEYVDEDRARQIVNAYIRIWNTERDRLASDSQQEKTRQKFYAGYPLHPELMDTLTEKTATIGNFQRVRGMLRVLSRMVERLWQKQPQNVHALHLHHLDPSFSPIRQEILTRWEQNSFSSALKADIAASDGDAPSLAEQMDDNFYAGLAPYTQNVARTIFLHSLAFNQDLKGATEQQLRYSILGPGLELSFVDDAIRRFRQESAYLDDRPNHPLSFQTEPNLNQIIHQRERQVDPQDIRNRLNDAIRETFKSGFFAPVYFPALPNNIEDNSEKPILAVIGYEATAVSVNQANVEIPDLVGRLFRYKNSDGTKRLNINNLVFIVADETQVENMKAAMRSRLALEDMQSPEAQEGLAQHQKAKLKERLEKSRHRLATSIQQTYRHIFYPAKNRLEGQDLPLNHSTIETQTASEKPGDGQKQIINVLADIKLRRRGESPDSAEFMAARTPLRNGIATTRKLHDEYRQNPALSMLEDDSILIDGIRKGIMSGDFVYRKNDLLFAKDLPFTDIQIGDDAEVMTNIYARDHNIWPRPAPVKKPDAGGQTAAAGHKPEEQQGSINTNKPTTKNLNEQVARYADEVQAEGILKQALTQIWELAIRNRFPAIGEMAITVFDANDGFILLALLNGIADCEKKASLNISYETANDDNCGMEYDGSLAGAQELRSFLIPQLRAAKDKSIKMVFSLHFPDGLGLDETCRKDFEARFTQVGAASAYVEAWARRREA